MSLNHGTRLHDLLTIFGSLFGEITTNLAKVL
jgi:hypothetical protein